LDNRWFFVGYWLLSCFWGAVFWGLVEYLGWLACEGLGCRETASGGSLREYFWGGELGVVFGEWWFGGLVEYLRWLVCGGLGCRETASGVLAARVFLWGRLGVRWFLGSCGLGVLFDFAVADF